MSINVPGIDAADLRRYINYDLRAGNPALAPAPAPAAASPLPAALAPAPAPAAASPLPAAPAPAPVPAPAPAFPAVPAPALPFRPLPAGNNAPAVVAAPVVEQPVPSWLRNPKGITRNHQALTIWPKTSNKCASLNYVQGKHEFVQGGADVVGSREWLRGKNGGVRPGSAAGFLVSLLGRNGWTNNRVIVDAYTRMFQECVDRFEAGGPEEYVHQWKKAEALVRQTLSKTQYNCLFINQNDAGIVGAGAAGGDCLWRLRQPGDPPKPEPTKGRRSDRSR